MSRVVVILTSENCGNKHRDFRRKWPSEAEKEIICYRLNNINPLHHVNIFVKCEYRNMVFIKDMLGFKFWMMLWWQIRCRHNSSFKIRTYQIYKKKSSAKRRKIPDWDLFMSTLRVLVPCKVWYESSVYFRNNANFFKQWLI